MKNDPVGAKECSRELLESAYAIAKEGLRKCYREGKILAALDNYPDHWARDTFWALRGVIAIGDTHIARSCLEYFMIHQKEDGHIPRKVSLDYDLLKYRFKLYVKRKYPLPIYSGLYPGFVCTDSNALFVIAFENYCRATGDLAFGRLFYARVRRAINWYERHLHEGFVKESFLANWMDSVIKNGKVLSTNVLYAAALEKFADCAFLLGYYDDAQHYRTKANMQRSRLTRHFWNGSYFTDELGDHRHFDVTGNVFACYFGIARKQHQRIIIERLIRMREGCVFLPTVEPLYPFWKINPVSRLFGMGDYHNGNSWLWVDVLAALVMHECGREAEARIYFSDICRIIIRDQAIHETYVPDGTLYGKCYGKSITPFAWNSGVFAGAWQTLAAT